MRTIARPFAILLLLLAAAPAAASPARPASSPTASPASIGNCATGVPRVTFYLANNLTGKSLIVCQSAASNLTVTHWNDGSCTGDDPFTLANETCTNDQFSSYSLLGPDANHCTFGHQARLEYFADISYQGPMRSDTAPMNGGSISFTMPSGWNNRISSLTVLCG